MVIPLSLVLLFCWTSLSLKLSVIKFIKPIVSSHSDITVMHKTKRSLCTDSRNCHWTYMSLTVLCVYADSLVEGRYADDPDYSRSRDHQEPPDSCDSQWPPDMVPAHQRRAPSGPRLVHVSDKHWPHEESGRLLRCRW